MPTSSRTTISGKVSAAQLVITNTLANPTIYDRVAARGYPSSELQIGQQLCDAALEAIAAQAAAAGAQRRFTAEAQAAERQARDCYQGLVQTVRAIFPADSSQRTALEVVGPMRNDSVAFIGAALTLYNNALSVGEIAEKLAKYGYDIGTLTGERAEIVRYQQALQAQVLAKSAAVRATAVQLQALRELQQWTGQYLKIVRVALRKDPMLLKALGISRPSGRPVSSRAKTTAMPEVATNS